MNGNPFYIAPPSLSGLGQIADAFGEARKEKKAEEKKQEELAKAQEVLATGDPTKIAEYSLRNPELGKLVQDSWKFKDERTKQNMKDSHGRILTGENPEKVLSERIAAVEAAGGDATDSRQELEDYRNDPQGWLQQSTNAYALQYPTEFNAYQKATQGEKTTYQQGTGDMAGYRFNPDTGSFSIDPSVKAALDAKASAKAAEGVVVDAKDRRAINKDVSALIDEPVGIHKSAESLAALKGRGTAAAKLAAVFKFMKALDPTSVVRESEQGQVYEAQGAARQLAGQINSILGQGKLSEEGFEDVVLTAQGLADSAIASSRDEIVSYLDTYEDTLPESFKAGLLARVPKAKGRQIKTAEQAKAAGWELKQDANGNKAYSGPNGQFIEVTQ